MRKTLTALAGALVLTAAPALAGEHGGCKASTQDCLNHLVKKLEARGWVGIELKPLENGRYAVQAVIDESPAAAAGLKPGDVLVAAEGLRYGEASEAEWSQLMDGWTAGRTVTYGIERDGRERAVKVRLAEMPPRVRFQMIGAHMLEHAQVAQAVN
jgi:predicted metalloprotease with PDZ domain